MRPRATGARGHPGTNPQPHDHHGAPTLVEFSNTSQSLPPGTTYDLDVPLPSSNFKIATVQLSGPAASGGGSGTKWRECASVHATEDTGDAMAHSVRTAGFKKVYAATYSKQVADSYLTHKVFDSNTSSSARYIALQDAQIIGSTLRLTFRNFFGGSATLWVKGSALLW